MSNNYVTGKTGQIGIGLRRLSLVMFLLAIQIVNVLAQDGIKVTGTVIDTSNETLIGATVMVKGTTIGTITDFDGKFIINVPDENSVLEVSYIGYESQTIPLKGQKNVIVRLQEEQTVLDEVVVVGYGVQKKESVVGAISQIGNKELLDAGTTNITNAIAGKLSGVMTMQASGQPGASNAEIVIRGVSSWNGNEPLVLVDGIERDFADIDPNEVASISVLKDASATAVFGARGANGVIIVTTKVGAKGKAKFKVTASHGISWATRVPENVGADATLHAYNEQKMNIMSYDKMISESTIQKHVNPSSPLEAVLYPDINWFELLTHKFAHVTNANANVSGGTDFINYFCSLGINHETSLFNTYQGESKYHNTNYDYKRFNYRTNLDFNLSNSSKLQLKVGGDISINNMPVSEPWRDIFGASGVSYPAYYPAWMLEEYPDEHDKYAEGIRLAATQTSNFDVKRNNPYTLLNRGDFTRTNRMKLFSDLIYNQKLDFITEGLSFQAKASLSTNYANQSLKSTYQRQTYLFFPENIGTEKALWKRNIIGEDDTYWHETPPEIGIGGLTDFQYDIHYEASLNYSRTFGKHAITALALMNRDIKHLKTDYPYLNEAWVGRATYDYSHRYLVEINMGYTGSERFAPSNRFGFFPSGAIGWVISEEKFFKESIPWWSKLKVRYSDGLVGSDYAEERWLYYSNYTNASIPNGTGTSMQAIVQDPAANLFAQWEQARKQDIGIEMGFFNDELTFSIDFFNEKRDKMLLSPRYNYFSGNTVKDQNLGSLKKHGYEVEVGYRKNTSYGLNYNIKAMLSFSENRIISKDDLPYAPEYMKEAGKPFGAQPSGQLAVDGRYMNDIDDLHMYPSVNSTVYMQNLGTFKYIDYNGDGVIGQEDVFSIEGSSYAPYIFSLSGGLAYKGFELSMVWSGNIGKYVIYDTAFLQDFGGDVKMYENMLDYWTPTNHDAKYHSLGGNNMHFAGGGYASGFTLRLMDHSWHRANYIKLKDLTVSYSFASKKLEKYTSISKLRFFLTGSNLLLFTELPMGDPESMVYSYGNYPQMSSVRFGMNVDF